MVIVNLLLIAAIIYSLLIIVYTYILTKELKELATPLINFIEMDQKSFELIEQYAISIKETGISEDFDFYTDTVIRLCQASQIGLETVNSLKATYLNEE